MRGIQNRQRRRYWCGGSFAEVGEHGENVFDLATLVATAEGYAVFSVHVGREQGCYLLSRVLLVQYESANFRNNTGGIGISTRLFLNQLTDVLGNGQNLLLLQPSAYNLQTDMGTMIDFRVICGFVSA